MKRIFFMFGIVLLASAFLITGAELATRVLIGSTNGGSKFLISTWEVWYTVAPESFLRFENHATIKLMRPVLALPGWVLFGIPGLILAAVFRNRDEDRLKADQFKDHEESLYLFDELAQAAAEEEGLSDLPDDRAPSNPNDIVPAEAHYAEDPVDDDLLPDRDFLLGGKSHT
ncbi:MAG: hypothetical protein OQK24_14320 [Magnetovibrio sp.]|nr:hypothetical protein [Magnetovibrio sp.]